MPWRKGGRTISDSCVDLDLEVAGRELIRAGGNVSAAARALGVRRGICVFCLRGPELIDAALEAEEMVVEEAEAVLFEAMRAGTCAGGLGRLVFFCAPLHRPAAWLRLGERETVAGRRSRGAGL